MDAPVVVTGIGLVTPHGVGVEQAWTEVVAGRSAIRGITRFDPAGFPVRFGAQVPDLPAISDIPAEVAPLAADLKGRLSVLAVREALQMSGLPALGPRAGVCIGSEAARPSLADVAHRLATQLPPGADELARMRPDAPTRLMAALAGATGPRSTVSTACPAAPRRWAKACCASVAARSMP